jgi:hypothetical protein
MRKFIIGGVAAIAMAAVSLGAAGIHRAADAAEVIGK